jgi:hypothetical protein
MISGFFDWMFEMPRPNKVWFRKDIGWWMVALSGKKHRLTESRQNKKLAEQKFHKLVAVRPKASDSPAARVTDIIARFLSYMRPNVSAETLPDFRETASGAACCSKRSNAPCPYTAPTGHPSAATCRSKGHPWIQP